MGLVPIRVVDDPNDPEGIRFKQVFQPGRVQWFIGVLKEIQARNAKQSAFLQYAPMIMTAGVLIFSFLIIFFLLQKMEVVTLQMAQTSAQNAETQRMFLDFVKQNSINVVKPA